MEETFTYTAFVHEKLLASGSLEVVLPALKAYFDHDASTLINIFEDSTGRSVDFDIRGTLREVIDRMVPPVRPGPGRPKLGVVSREVSLLPRHWTWLEEQPNGASAALRRLLDEAKNKEGARYSVRRAMDATGRFMTAMAGNLPDYEEATRSLYAADRKTFDSLIKDWPQDIRMHIQHLAQNVFDPEKRML